MFENVVKNIFLNRRFILNFNVKSVGRMYYNILMFYSALLILPVCYVRAAMYHNNIMM